MPHGSLRARLERFALSPFTMFPMLCLLLSGTCHADSPGVPIYSNLGSHDQAMYERVIRLQHNGAANGTLLVTFEHDQSVTAPGYLVVLKSTDNGITWTSTQVPEPAQRKNMDQPFLFEVPRTIGNLAAGTVILVENSADSTATRFYMFTSTDGGSTFGAGTLIDTGGPAGANAAPGTGIWEPFLMVDGLGNLNLYFSDERQSGTYSQFLGGYSYSTTLKAFDTAHEFNVVTSSTSTDRPGMITIAKVPTASGPQYIASFEVCTSLRAGVCPVHIKTSTDGHTWTPGDTGLAITARDNKTPTNNPYIAWSPAGGPNGQLQLISEYTNVSTDNSTTVLVNNDPTFSSSAWEWIPRPFVPYPSINQYGVSQLPSWDGTQVSLFGEHHPSVLTGTSNAGILPFADTFSLGADFGWTAYPEDGASWTANALSATYSSAAGAGYRSVAGSTGWSNYTLKTDLDATSAGQVGVLVRVSNTSAAADGLNGYYFAFNPSTHSFFGGREDSANTSWTSLQSTTISSLTTNQWYTMSVTANGSNFTATISLQGSSSPLGTLSFTDATYATGAIGLRNYNATASWKNVGVVSLNPTSTVTAGTHYKIVNQKSSLVIGVLAPTGNVGQHLIQYTDNGTADHAWVFEAVTNSPGFYRIRNNSSGDYMTVASMNQTPGTAVTQQALDTSVSPTDQYWQLIPAGNGYFHIVNQGTGQLLAVAGGSTSNSATIEQWYDNDTSDHNWKLQTAP